MIIRRVSKQYKTPREAGRAYFGELQHGTDPAEDVDQPGPSSTTVRQGSNSEGRTTLTEATPSDELGLAAFQNLLS